MLARNRFDTALSKLLGLEDLEPYGTVVHCNAFRRPKSFHDPVANVKDVLLAQMLQVAREPLDLVGPGAVVVDDLFDVFLTQPDHADVLGANSLHPSTAGPMPPTFLPTSRYERMTGTSAPRAM